MIEIEGLHKHFGPLHVLRGIDLSVARGEVVCIIGPSGSGKSTLLRCINHLEEAQQGASASTASSAYRDEVGGGSGAFQPRGRRGAGAGRHGVPARSTCSRTSPCSAT